MGKRVSAKDMLSAGRARPPRESLPEQPVIPARTTPIHESASTPVNESTERLLHLVTSRHGQLSTSSPVDQATSVLSDLVTSALGAQKSSDLSAQSTSAPVVQSGPLAVDQLPADVDSGPGPAELAVAVAIDQSTTELVDPKLTLTDQAQAAVDGVDAVTGPLVAKSLFMDPSEPPRPGSGNVGEKLTSALVAKSTSLTLNQETGDDPIQIALTALGPELLITPGDKSTSELVTMSTSPLICQNTDLLMDSTTEQSQDQEASQLVALSPTEDDETWPDAGQLSTKPLVAKSGRRREPKPSAAESSFASPPAANTAPATLLGEPTGTYQRLTVFLTPAQRTWLKTTGRRMPVEGLSVSDIVRLAVTRLSLDVTEGLPLVQELTAQAHTEAQTMVGRRNRGLPPTM